MPNGEGGDHNAIGPDSKVVHVEGGAKEVRADTYVNVMQAAAEKRTREEKLFVAVKKGDTATVETLLTEGVGANAAHKDGTTLLHIAARYKQLAVVKILLKEGANVLATRTDGSIPLHVAAREDSPAVVRELLHRFRAQQINTLTLDGSTPLHMAVQENYPDVVEMLLESGTDVNAIRRGDGYTPLQVVAGCGHLEVAKVLLRHGALIDPTLRKYNCIAKAEQDIAEEKVQAEAQQEQQVKAVAKKNAEEDAIRKQAVEQFVKEQALNQLRVQVLDPAQQEALKQLQEQQAQAKAEQDKLLKDMAEQLQKVTQEKEAVEKARANAEKKAEAAEKAKAQVQAEAEQAAEAARKAPAQAEAPDKECAASFAMDIQRRVGKRALAKTREREQDDAASNGKNYVIGGLAVALALVVAYSLYISRESYLYERGRSGNKMG